MYLPSISLIHPTPSYPLPSNRYRQQKFNLLREESEGYAKLLTELEACCSCVVVADPRVATTPLPLSPKTLQSRIHSLIGFFDLDPNRVLDVLLDAFCMQTTRTPGHHHQLRDLFLRTFRLFPWKRNVYASLMGFKFQFYAEHHHRKAPRSLYEGTAILIQHGFMSLDDIYPFLAPVDIEITAGYEKFVIQCKLEARKLDQIIIGGDPTTQKPAAAGAGAGDNQKSRLCAAFLYIGEFQRAMMLLKRFPKLCALDHRVVSLFCQHLHLMIEPLYARYIFMNGMIIGLTQNTRHPLSHDMT